MCILQGKLGPQISKKPLEVAEIGFLSLDAVALPNVQLTALKHWKLINNNTGPWTEEPKHTLFSAKFHQVGITI